MFADYVKMKVRAAPTYDTPNTPEHALLAHMLVRAVLDLYDPDPNIQARAYAWFQARDDSSWSASWVCSYLNLNVCDVRRFIIAMRERGHKLAAADLIRKRVRYATRKYKGGLKRA